MKARWGMVAVLVAALLVVTTPTSSAQGSAPSPTLSIPPPGIHGYALWDSYYDLAPFGYEEQELFVAGTARALDGSTAPYTTRIIVTRPKDASRFNGTVLLDWVNVTAQFENAVDTMLTRPMLMREGFAYVHVSAQKAGVCCTPLTPQVWDPERYQALNHPGDDYSWDMFTQVAEAFKAPAGIDPMGSIGAANVKRVLAAGQSQSANRLQNYISEWLPAHPEAVGVIDGILVHGNVPGNKTFGAKAPIPVLHLLSDYEAQDDGVNPATIGPNYRLWEIAGTSHADYFIGYQSEFGHGPRVVTGAPKRTLAQYNALMDNAGQYGELLRPLDGVCVADGATMPMRYADSSAIDHLNKWVATGVAPPNGPRFQFASGKLAKDHYGNTRGGIRLPPIDVPVAHYQSTTCQLGGETIPFTGNDLLLIYGSFANYYAQMRTKTDAAVTAGWMLAPDAVDLMNRVCGAKARFSARNATCPYYAPPTTG